MPIKKRILLIDGECKKHLDLLSFLKEYFIVDQAESIEKIPEFLINNNEPDVFVVSMNSYDSQLSKSLDFIKYRFPHIPLIVMGHVDDESEVIDILESGADEFINCDNSQFLIRTRIKKLIDIKEELLRTKIIEKQVESSEESLENDIMSKIFELEEVKDNLDLLECNTGNIIDSCPKMDVPKKILIVDDKPENIHILIENLKSEYDLYFATNGIKALDIAQANKDLDLILLDLIMPGMDGYEVCNKLKDPQTWHIPIIILTASSEEVDEIKSLNMGAVDFISKPFHIPIVKARIKAALRLKDEMDRRRYVTNKLGKLNQELEFKVKEKARELQLAHDNLLASEKKYRQIYENSIEGIFISNSESEYGKFISVSPSLSNMLGYDSPDDLLENVENLKDHVYVDESDFFEFRRLINHNREVSNFVVDFLKKDKTVIKVNIYARTIEDRNESRIYFQGFLIDVTENKKIEEDNKRHMEELALLNSIISSSLKLTKAEPILESACRELGELYSLPVVSAFLYNESKDEILISTQYISDSFSSDEKSAIKEKLKCKTNDKCYNFFSLVDKPKYFEKDSFAQGGLTSVNFLKYFLVVPISSSLEIYGWVVLSYSEKSSASDYQLDFAKSLCDQIAGALGRIRIEEQRFHLESLYHQSQKMEALGKFTSGVAHDFNNILTVILAEAELLQLGMSEKEENAESLSQIVNASKRAVDLVKQLLAFSRQQILKIDLVDVNHVIENFHSMISRIIGSNIETHIKLDKNLGEILMDKGQLEQVLMNLIVNARDAMPDGGSLFISTYSRMINEIPANSFFEIEKGGYAVVEVRDTGTGMSSKTLKHMFEPFYTTKKAGEGTGLGLSTVHGIVSQSKGFIEVESKEGEGTLFKINLPFVKDMDIREKLRVEKNSFKGGTETIAVLEDDVIMANLLVDMLKTAGYTVFMAHSEKEIKDLFKETGEGVNLIVSDIILPGKKSGILICEELIKEYPETEVLYISGYSEDDIREKGGFKENLEFLKKPFSIQDLDKKIRTILD